MDTRVILLSIGLTGVAAIGNAAAGQHEGHQAGAAPSAAQVTECRQAQPVIAELLNAALKRLEDARLTNSAAAMRGAANDVQAALVDMRTKFTPCSAMQMAPTVAPTGQAAAPAPTGTPASAGTREPQPNPTAPVAAVPPHAGHAAPAAPPASTSRAPANTPARPSVSAQRPATPPAAADSHAGHTTPAAPAARTSPPLAVRPSAPVRPPAPASDAHVGHVAPPAAAAPPTPLAGSRTGEATPPTNIAGLTCQNVVDPKTAPRMLYQGRMYYFCTEASRAAFAKDPSKFGTALPQAAPTHAH